MGSRLAGLLLFAPVPLVLFLFTRLPLGVVASLGLGTAIMATHRFYARPFAVRRASTRCLWCGRAALLNAVPLTIVDPLGAVDWRACASAHADRVRRTLGWANRHTAVLKAGVLGGLAVLLPGAVAAHFGWLGPLRPDDGIAYFRLSVALAVLPLGWVGPESAAALEDPLPAPFPMHLQALIGTVAVVWLFRLVGLAWLVLSLAYGAARF
jgi:hypothetical protein